MYSSTLCVLTLASLQSVTVCGFMIVYKEPIQCQIIYTHVVKALLESVVNPSNAGCMAGSWPIMIHIAKSQQS